MLPMKLTADTTPVETSPAWPPPNSEDYYLTCGPEDLDLQFADFHIQPLNPRSKKFIGLIDHFKDKAKTSNGLAIHVRWTGTFDGTAYVRARLPKTSHTTYHLPLSGTFFLRASLYARNNQILDFTPGEDVNEPPPHIDQQIQIHSLGGLNADQLKQHFRDPPSQSRNVPTLQRAILKSIRAYAKGLYMQPLSTVMETLP
jgi:hypothetical protein